MPSFCSFRTFSSSEYLFGGEFGELDVSDVSIYDTTVTRWGRDALAYQERRRMSRYGNTVMVNSVFVHP